MIVFRLARVVNDNAGPVNFDEIELGHPDLKCNIVLVDEGEQIFGRDVPAGDVEQPGRAPVQDMRSAEIVVLCDGDALLGICDARDLSIGERRAARIILDVPRIVAQTHQVLRQRARQLLVDEKTSHDLAQEATRSARADESSAAYSIAARISSRSSSS